MKVNSSIFKAYDIRGIWEQDLNAEIGDAIGRAYATYLKPKRIVCGRDVRVSGPQFQRAVIEGMLGQGVDVVDIGVVTSDALYFAVGKFGFDGGAMVTASHNPPEWNGVKFTRDEAKPLFGPDNLAIGKIIADNKFDASAKTPGTLKQQDILHEYVAQVLSFSHAPKKALKVVIDPGNGTAARFIGHVMKRLPYTWEGINLEQNGMFPGRNPNPLATGALDGLKEKILATKADVGVAFDADADRMFLMDEKGNRIFGDVLTALLAKQFLTIDPGAAIVYNLICSHMVPEEILKAGGKPIQSRVGHAFMKPAMREHKAVFGGEISGHFFFRDHYFADSGLIAMVVALEYLSRQDRPLSELVQEIDIYAHDAEHSIKTNDGAAIIARVKEKYGDGKVDEIDGLTVEYPDWWFNLRPSNTEPIIKLSLEAKTPSALGEHKAALLALIG